MQILSVRDDCGNNALVLACNTGDGDEIRSHLTLIFLLYKHGIVYEVSNMIKYFPHREVF